MPCTCPMDAYPAPPWAADRRPVFSASKSYSGAKAFRIPCGQCMGCRIDRSRDWATRCFLESKMHECSWFVTPTYAPEHLPADLSVSVRTHQLFMKRVRFRFGDGIRFLGVGEYGGVHRRPHYHTLLFGLDLSDAVEWSRPGRDVLYRSPEMEKLWPYGQILCGRVTHESAAYVARYCIKKVRSGGDDSVYEREAVDPVSGEVRRWRVRPEFLVASRRPGLGDAWFRKFASDCFPSDFLVVDGKRVSVPRYFAGKLSEVEKSRVVCERKRRAAVHAENNTERRLMTRHESAQLSAAKRERKLEDGC